VKAGTKITGAASGNNLTGLTNGTAYTVLVEANKAGYASIDSAVQQKTPVDTAPPLQSFASAPALSLEAGDGWLSYTWTPSDPPADSYDLYYTPGAAADAAAVKAGTKITGAASGNNLTGLTNGTAYTVLVVANKAGYASIDSAVQQKAPVDTAPPLQSFASAPALSLEAGNGSLVYTWTTSDPPADSYDLYYVQGAAADAAAVKAGNQESDAVSGNALAGLINGETYSVLLTARKAGYTSIDSAVQQAAPAPGAPSAFDAPPVLSLSAEDGALSYTWTPSAPPADSYNLYYVQGAAADAAAVQAGTKITGAASGGKAQSLTNGVTYSVLVEAVKTGYANSYSGIKQAAPESGVSTFDSPPTVSLERGIQSLTYTWTASSPAADYYDVYYAQGETEDTGTVKAGTKITSASSGGTITGLADGTTYSVLVEARKEGYENRASAVVSQGTWSPGDQMTRTVSGGITIHFRYVPGGKFQRDNAAANVSAITKGYWMAETTVTQELYQAVMGSNPSRYDGSTGWRATPAGETQAKRPADNMTWYAAIAFCNRLSLLHGKEPVYSVSGVSDWATAAPPTANNADWNAAVWNLSKNGYRLPTETEWMWAAMGAPTAGRNGGTDTAGGAKAFAGSTGSNTLTDYAWTDGNANTGASTQTVHEVAKKLPNELNLYDMSGNQYEWCWDWFAGSAGNTNTQNSWSNLTGLQTDYPGEGSGSQRARRGGCIDETAAVRFRVDYRDSKYPESPALDTGFRIASP
jgi:formylglycine-generating enzyme required for sulfatase activity